MSLKLLTNPEVWIFILLIVGCFAAWRDSHCQRTTRCILFLLLTFYYGFTTRPLAEALIRPLETYYQAPSPPLIVQDAMVLFVTSSAKPPRAERPTIVGTRNQDIFLCGLVYLNGDSASKVILLGERFPEENEASADSTTLKEWAILLGYPKDTLIVRAQTDATHFRTKAVKQLLGERRKVLLLDSAMHLPRSAAAFTKEGFIVTPIPCDYVISTEPWTISDFVPQGGHLMSTSAAVHEYIALLIYWMRGFI
jgi:uncharacterized SAM-binding protein YcdF (DUF218 family)